MSRLRALLAVVVVALFATGCVRSDLTVVVNEDGSGTYTAIVAINPDAFGQLADLSGEDDSGLGEDPCVELRNSADENQQDLPQGSTVEAYSDGDFCGIKITAPFEAGDNPSDAISEALSGSDAMSSDLSGIGLEAFRIERDGSGWVFEAAAVDDGSETSSEDLGLAESFLKGASSIVRIKLPGRMVESDSNPDAVDGDGTMIWNLSLTGSNPTLRARTEPGDPITSKTYTEAGKSLPNIKGAGGAGGSDGGSSVLPWILGGLVVIAAIVGFVLWKRKSSSPSPANPGVAQPWDPAGSTTPPAPTSGAPTAQTPQVPPTTTPYQAPGTTAVATAPEPGQPQPGEPQWDAARNTYIVWDAGSSKWLQYDNAAAAWKPIE